MSRTIYSIFGLLIASFVSAKERPFKLQFYDIKHYQIARSTGLSAIYREGSSVLATPERARIFLDSNYQENAKEIDLGFGSGRDPLDRVESYDLLGKDSAVRSIRGIYKIEEDVFFLDAKRQQYLIWNQKTKLWREPSDIILDLFLPPDDSRGAASLREARALQKAFRQSFKLAKVQGDVIRGMAKLPLHWQKGDKSQFILLLALSDFPLLTVSCEGDVRKLCKAERACFTKGFSSEYINRATGITLLQKQKELWVSMQNPNQILRLSAGSCYQVAYKGIIDLPQELPPVSNVFIDQKDMLWISTQRPDDRYSASLFVWEGKTLPK